MNVLFSDNLTGSNGSAWDGAKWTTDVVASGVIDIQSNEGSLFAANVASSNARAVALHTPINDSECVFKWRKSTTSVQNSWRVYLRGSGDWAATSPTPVTAGTGIQVVGNSNSISMIKMSGTFGGIGSTITYPASNDTNSHWCRMRVVGDQLYVKFWADGSGEPATWSGQATTPVVSAGVFQLGNAKGNGTDVSTLFIDDVQVGTVPRGLSAIGVS